MKVRRNIDKRIRHQADGINVVADVKAAIAANVNEDGSSDSSVSSRQKIVQRSHRRSSAQPNPEEESKMSENETNEQELSAEELEKQGAEELPAREAMSLIDANLAAPVNAAVAANVLSDNSTATADATQTVDIDQSNN